MSPDSDSTPSRRQLLHAGGIALTAGIAGCTTNTQDSTETTPTKEPVEKLGPPAFYAGAEHDISHAELPTLHNRLDPTDLTYGGTTAGHLEDSRRLFQLYLESTDQASLLVPEFEFVRPITLTLSVRDRNLEYHTRSRTIRSQPPFDRIDARFDISNIALPRMAGGLMTLTIEDAHEKKTETKLATRKQFLIVPHKNGEKIVREHELTAVQKYGKTQGGAVEKIDNEDERTLFLATRCERSNEIYGVSCHIAHEAHDHMESDSKEMEEYRKYHGPGWEAPYARQISHFQELGRKTATALDRLEITDPRERLEHVGRLTRSLKYKQQDYTNPTHQLYKGQGDCDLKSYILANILLNEPWNQTHVTIMSAIYDSPHADLGIDVDELDGNIDLEQSKTISPSQEQLDDGYKDTEYVWFSMIRPTDIGEKPDAVSVAPWLDDYEIITSTDIPEPLYGVRDDDQPPQY
jgi:hypothetical protein